MRAWMPACDLWPRTKRNSVLLLMVLTTTQDENYRTQTRMAHHRLHTLRSTLPLDSHAHRGDIHSHKTVPMIAHDSRIRQAMARARSHVKHEGQWGHSQTARVTYPRSTTLSPPHKRSGVRGCLSHTERQATHTTARLTSLATFMHA
jgi:hypothetical protein